MPKAHKTEQPGLAGSRLQYERPDWEPLQNLVEDDVVEQFMWMREVELEDGTRLHAYKHRWNRRYIHVTARGEAYYYDWDGETREEKEPPYRQLPLRDALTAVLGSPRWPEVERMNATLERWEAQDAASVGGPGSARDDV